MKLLAKSQIDKAKAADRQREIAEGLKLAENVDTLREVRAQEEASLEKFRRETIEAIHEEIMLVSAKLADLLGEVKGLEGRREEALKPLTERENGLMAATQELDIREEALIARESSVSTVLTGLESRERGIEKREKEVGYAHEDAMRRVEDADIMKRNADRMHQAADNILREANAKAEAQVANAEQREKWVKEREARVSEKEEELRKKEIDLAKEWSLLKDRQEVQKRNIKRLT